MSRIPYLSTEPTPAMAADWTEYSRLAIEYDTDPADRDDLVAGMATIARRIADHRPATTGDLAVLLQLVGHLGIHGEGYGGVDVCAAIDAAIAGAAALFPGVQPPAPPAHEPGSPALAELRSHALRLGAGWMAATLSRHGVKRLGDIPPALVAGEAQRAALA